MKRWNNPWGTAAAIVALVLLANLVTGGEPQSAPAVPPVAVSTTAPRERYPADELDLARLIREPRGLASPKDLFGGRTTPVRPTVPPVPQPVAVAATAEPKPAPQPPPLPYRYLGRMIQRDKTHLYLLNGDDIIVTEAGETLNTSYRVDSVTESSVTFRFLPLDAVQFLDISKP